MVFQGAFSFLANVAKSIAFIYLRSLRRGGDGQFSDNDVASILQAATETIAGAPRARGIAPCMRVVEMIVIEQARKWNVCSLNEFRRFLGLKRLYNFFIIFTLF
jgi:linoleate 10R-lipoxygenase